MPPRKRASVTSSKSSASAKKVARRSPSPSSEEELDVRASRSRTQAKQTARRGRSFKVGGIGNRVVKSKPKPVPQQEESDSEPESEAESESSVASEIPVVVVSKSKNKQRKAKSDGPQAESAGTSASSSNNIVNLIQSPEIQALAALLASTAQRSSETQNQESVAQKFRGAEAAVLAFDNKVDVDDWGQHFLKETESLNAEQQLRLFRMKTAKVAFAWQCDTEAKANREEWTIHDWLLSLRKEFKPTSVQLRAAITSRKQREDENAETFIRDMVALCKRYQPSMAIEDKIAYITANVHPRYDRMFRALNIHATSISMTEQSLRGAMDFAGQHASEAAASDVKQRVIRPSMSSLSAEALSMEGLDSKPSDNRAIAAYLAAEAAGKDERDAAPANQIQTQPEQRRCFNCNKTGHLASTCWAPKSGQKQDQRQSHQRQNQQSGSRMSIAELKAVTCCNKCGRRGHWAAECYAKTKVDSKSSAPIPGQKAIMPSESGNGK